jgi:hypothetical protein
MGEVRNLAINEARTSVSWTYDEKEIQINAENIGQCMEDKIHGKIIVSLNKGEHPYQVKVFEITGEQLFLFDDPKPFEFYYLKEHSQFGVSIVCVSDEPVDGRMDWQFEVDYETGQLKRSAPSY